LTTGVFRGITGGTPSKQEKILYFIKYNQGTHRALEKHNTTEITTFTLASLLLLYYAEIMAL